MTLSEILQHYLLHRIDLADSTAQQYCILLRQFNCWAGRVVTIKELTAELILQYMRHRKASGKSSRTCNNARQLLLTLWRHASRKQFTKRIPPDSQDLPKMKSTKRLPEAWSLPELKRILHACQNTPPLPYWDYRSWVALILVIYDTGHRLEAVLSARREDIRDGFLTVRHTKQNREISHSLHPETLEAISRIPDHESGLIFNYPFRRRQIWRHYGDILDDAGLSSDRRSKFHKIRRSSATHLLAAGASISSVEDHLGHATRGIALSTYVDARFVPHTNASELLPRP